MIDREKVIKGLEGVLDWLSEGEDRKCVAAYRAVEDALEQLREQEPVAHATWLCEETSTAYDLYGVKTWAAKYKCSKCGSVHRAIEAHMCYSYCPMCGARMDGDLLDGIAEARALEKIDNAPTIGGWISVKDMLPDAAGYECLVCAVNENTHQTHVFTAFTGYGEPGWWTSNVDYMSRAKSPNDNRLHSALRVTHWMPLPEMPGKETWENE